MICTEGMQGGRGAHDEGHAHIMHTSCTHTRGQKDQKNSANKLGEKDNHQRVNSFYLFTVHIVHIQIT